MSRLVLAVALVCTAVSVTAQELLPCEVPFECASDVRVGNAIASWRMSFDPRYAGVYDIVHWKIAYTPRLRVEYMAQLMRPWGKPPYYRFFVCQRRGAWYTLGIRKRWVWREVRRPSPEQDMMVGRLQLLFGNAQALRHGADPVSLKF